MRLSPCRTFACTVAIASLALVGCSGPNTPVLIKGEPVCADFDLGGSHTPMKGGLKQPIQVRTLEGSKVIATTLVYGRRTEATPEARFLVPDSSEEYTIEWAQCPNERATETIGKDEGKSAAGAKYLCGETKPYTTTKLETKRGDHATFKVDFAPPADMPCWASEGPPPAPTASATAEAPPVPEPTAAPTASATAEPAISASASAPTSSAAAPPTSSARVAPTSSAR